MKIEDLIHRIQRRWMKLRLQPIRVLCFHQVGETFDERLMWPCDWNEIGSFKQRILKLKEEYQFISLYEAYEHIRKDRLRRKRYAVLTADDGFVTLPNILPWLAEQQIPVTLFLNPAYLTGAEIPGRGVNSLLSIEELDALIRKCQPYVTIASHGWTHQFCTTMSNEEFIQGVEKSVNYLQKENEYVPFFAYPCGKHTEFQDLYLLKKGIVPVYCDGMVNYNDSKRIHRECIDEGMYDV